MNKSNINKYKSYNFEITEIYTEQALNYKRLEQVFNYERIEQAIINSQKIIEETKTKEKEEKSQRWNDLLKIKNIPENSSWLKTIGISIYNDLRYFKAFLFYKKEYAEYTSVNKELQRIVPILIYTLIEFYAIIVIIGAIITMIQHGFNLLIVLLILLCVFFAFLFRMAKIELDQTKNDSTIENSFDGSVAIIGIVIAILAIVIDFNGGKSNNNTNQIFKPTDCSVSINLDQIAYITDANDEGKHVIYFSNGLNLTVSQVAYDEIYTKMNK